MEDLRCARPGAGYWQIDKVLPSRESRLPGGERTRDEAVPPSGGAPCSFPASVNGNTIDLGAQSETWGQPWYLLLIHIQSLRGLIHCTPVTSWKFVYSLCLHCCHHGPNRRVKEPLNGRRPPPTAAFVPQFILCILISPLLKVHMELFHSVLKMHQQPPIAFRRVTGLSVDVSPFYPISRFSGAGSMKATFPRVPSRGLWVSVGTCLRAGRWKRKRRNDCFGSCGWVCRHQPTADMRFGQHSPGPQKNVGQTGLTDKGYNSRTGHLQCSLRNWLSQRSSMAVVRSSELWWLSSSLELPSRTFPTNRLPLCLLTHRSRRPVSSLSHHLSFCFHYLLTLTPYCPVQILEEEQVINQVITLVSIWIGYLFFICETGRIPLSCVTERLLWREPE